MTLSALLSVVVAAGLSAPLMAEVCTPDKVGAAVDQAGASLRAYNSEAQPKLRERLKSLADKKGWKSQDAEEQAVELLADGKVGEFDTQANDLLSRIDVLGRPGADGAVACTNIPEITAASAELLAVMKTKTAYLNRKLDTELGEPAGVAKPAAEVAEKKPEVTKPVESKPEAKKAEEKKPEPAAVAAAKTETKPSTGVQGSWQSTAIEGDVPADGSVAAVPVPPLEAIEVSREGYSIDEIRDVSRGFFGTISTELASVIEYAFSSAGRPSGYVLGTEGGGAFLAGLRYGKGTLYMRQGGTMPVYWHGPSIGSDFGAEGGRTLFLVYRLDQPEKLFRTFTGVDGSAYLVGGVGLTLLKGGKIIMAPIRSGIGFRLGANIGYLRFTDRPTWNPF